MDIIPGEISTRDAGKLLNAAIIPRPIAWVSSISAGGQSNLAPFSYFNGVCSNPPTVMFSVGVRAGSFASKDTYNNIVETGEFVINFVTEPLAQAMNITAVETLPEVNEFERAGLTAAPGTKVNVPHVAETPIYFECLLHEIVTVSDQPGGAHIVIGTVIFMHFDDLIYREGYYLDIEAYQPIGRTTGPGYARTTDRFDLQRPPSEILGS